MRKFAVLLGISLLCLSACKPSAESHSKAILGAVLIDGRGGPPLTDSVVVVAGGLVQSAGARSNVPIPGEAAKINGAGKFLVPALIDACDRAAFAAALHPSSVTEAASQVAALAAKGAKAIQLADVPYEIAEAAIEAARRAGIPLIARASTSASLRRLADAGASGFIGMVPDADPLDPALISHLRDLRVFIAPVLAHSAATRNTAQAFRGGVPIVLASGGGDLQNEIELLVEAGIPPLDAIVAGTRNSAAALGRVSQIGTIEAGKEANLVLVSANPAEDVRNLRQIALRILDDPNR